MESVLWPPSAFSQIAPLQLGQFWLPQPQPDFRSGIVWLATTSTSFVVLAELTDEEIQTLAVQHNDPLWDLGDVFEIFVRHSERPDYFEFHVAPNGITADLHYPKLGASRSSGVSQYMLQQAHFIAKVSIQSASQRWRIAAEFPVSKLVPRQHYQQHGNWKFSFSRYDAVKNRPPVVSSTSLHPLPDFHRAQDWSSYYVSEPFSSRRK